MRHGFSGQGLAGLYTAGPVLAPYALIAAWLEQALADQRVPEPTTMALATVEADGTPDVRLILIHELSPLGPALYTGLESAKAHQLRANDAAAAVLGWHPVFRQLRVRGPVAELGREQVEQYWASRPRDFQIAGVASRQSAAVSSPEQLRERVEAAAARAGGQPVPLPDSWDGYRLRPVQVEAWAGQPSRLHDRIRWVSSTGRPADLADAAAWTWSRLQP